MNWPSLEEMAQQVLDSEPARPPESHLRILERWKAQYEIGCYTLSAREYWLEYVPDCLAWEANQIGMSREKYIEWEMSAKMPLCGAVTKKKTLCKNKIYGSGNWLNPQEWLSQHRDGYCRVHGGE